MPEYKRKPNTHCVVCAKNIYRRPSEIDRGRVFCSKICNGVADRKERPCVICKKPILASANKKTCSRSCSNKNRSGIIYKIGSPKDKVATQRAIKIRLLKQRGDECERCGYAKREILHVHHKDRNKNNNNLTNLELLCPNCHYEEHYLEKSWLNDTLPRGGVG